MKDVIDARHLLLEKLYYEGYNYLVRSNTGGYLIATVEKPIRIGDGLKWITQGKECLIQDYRVLQLISIWDKEPRDIMSLFVTPIKSRETCIYDDDIKEIVEDTIEDLFDDLLTYASQAQTQTDIVDGMENSLWERGDKLIEKLNIMLKEKEETSEIKRE